MAKKPTSKAKTTPAAPKRVPLVIKAGDKTTRLSPHFMAHEFYSTSPRDGFGAVPQHELYPQLVDAAEILRTAFNKPWSITSTYRNEAHERAILKAAGKAYFLSEHTLCKAFDSHSTDRSPATTAALHDDFINGGPVYVALRRAGITGFGLYDWGVHLDCRDDNFIAQRHDGFGLVAWWDSRSGKKKSWSGAVLTPTAKNLPRLAENPGEVLT